MATNYININNPVYISYAWANNEHPDIELDVKKLCALLDENDIYYIDQSTGGNIFRRDISEVETEMSNSPIIVVFSDRYFTSLHCMYEWHCIRKNGKMNDHIFPILLKDVQIKDDTVIDHYLHYFYGKKNELVQQEVEGIIPLTYIEKKACEAGFFIDDFYNLIKYLRSINCRVNDYSIVIENIKLYLKQNADNSNIHTKSTPNLPQFSLNTPELIRRDGKVDLLFELISNNKIVNLVGIGGSGKTSLAYLLADKYKDYFFNIAYVVVNGNLKEDFVSQINATLNLDFAPNMPIDEQYKTVISFMDQYKTVNNLLILDINETAGKNAIADYAKKLQNNNLPANKIYPNGWNILILSRDKFGDFHRHNLNDNVDKPFLKRLFLDKAGERYKGFDNFDGLFNQINYSPLLAEQLGMFLKKQPKMKSFVEMQEILSTAKFRNKELSGISAFNRNETETTIISFLKSLIDFNSFELDEQELLRHFVLWKSEYIQYDIIEDLLQDICEDLEETLSNLYDRSILNFDETKSAYKLHGLLADSLREQIDVTKQDYKTYFDNIERIRTYNFREFLPYADCIGNSLCEYDITKNLGLLTHTALKFYDTWKTDYAQKLYDKCIEISNQRLETEPENIDYLKDLSYSYNNLANLQQYRLNDYESAENNYNKAIKIAEKIIKISYSPKYLNSLAMHYINLANLQVEYLNATKSAETNYQKTIEILEKITETSDNPEYLYGLARAYYNLAKLQEDSLNDYDSAEIHYNKAIKIGEEIRKITDNPEYLNQLSAAYTNLANLQKNQEKYESAIDNCKKAIEIKDKIKDINLEYLVDWLESKDILAELYIATDNSTEAQAIVDEIKPEAEELLEEFPDYGYLQRVNGWIKDTESRLNQQNGSTSLGRKD
ncbi:MAG: toll/interleukin-1 receptor domain-containing protein [Bacteroidales bacterium]|nr:toll/interleukin-1 receptor domain-containing protein [Bacteroidales bacterium]